MDISSILTTNWYVLTGGPSSGKTTTIELLAARGFKTTIEHARHYIQTQMQKGETVEEVRRNQERFLMGVPEMQIEQEAILNPADTVFLDRALPDALAYYHFLGLPINDKLNSAVKKYRYKKVFVLDRLPLVHDYARREDEIAQKKIHELLIKVYSDLRLPIVTVPVLPRDERVDFIVRNL